MGRKIGICKRCKKKRIIQGRGFCKSCYNRWYYKKMIVYNKFKRKRSCLRCGRMFVANYKFRFLCNDCNRLNQNIYYNPCEIGSF